MGVGTLVMVDTAGKAEPFVQFYKSILKSPIFSQCPPVEPVATAWNEKKYQQIKIQHINFLFIIKCRPGARVHTHNSTNASICWTMICWKLKPKPDWNFLQQSDLHGPRRTRVTAGILRSVRCKSVKYDVMIWLQCHEHVHREHSLSWPSGSWNACREGESQTERGHTMILSVYHAPKAAGAVVRVWTGPMTEESLLEIQLGDTQAWPLARVEDSWEIFVLFKLTNQNTLNFEI